jgi:hypothetical protein
MRFVMAVALVLMTSPSFADESAAPLSPAAPSVAGPQTLGPLAPGKPAGVKEASNHDLFIWISLSLIAITVGGVALTYIHTGGSASTATTSQ